MRWLLPNRRNLPTALLAAWNAPLVTMLSEKREIFAGEGARPFAAAPSSNRASWTCGGIQLAMIIL